MHIPARPAESEIESTCPSTSNFPANSAHALYYIHECSIWCIQLSLQHGCVHLWMYTYNMHFFLFLANSAHALYVLHTRMPYMVYSVVAATWVCTLVDVRISVVGFPPFLHAPFKMAQEGIHTPV